MYELIQVSEHDYYIDCPAKIGVIRTGEKEVVLIDAGSDKDAAKKVLKAVEAQGWSISAVYITHSHADHIGGCALLQSRTGCRIYAPGVEAAYAAHTLLESCMLYGGLPFHDLKNKFFYAQASHVEALTQTVLPEGMSVLPLPGHSPEMVGFLTADGTAYIGDALSSEAVLAKYALGYHWDPDQAIASIRALKTVSARFFVSAHAPALEDIRELADVNIEAIEAVKALLLSLLAEPLSFEELLGCVFEHYGMRMNVQQYALIGSVLHSYLSDLYEAGKIAFTFENNRMLWKTIA